MVLMQQTITLKMELTELVIVEVGLLMVLAVVADLVVQQTLAALVAVVTLVMVN